MEFKAYYLYIQSYQSISYKLPQHLHKEAVDEDSYKAVTYMTHVQMFFPDIRIWPLIKYICRSFQRRQQHSSREILFFYVFDPQLITCTGHFKDINREAVELFHFN